MKTKVSMVFIIVFTLTFILYQYALTSKRSDIQNIAEQTLSSTLVAYMAIIDTYKIAAQKDLYTLMNDEHAMDILKEFKYAKPYDQGVLRGRLYRHLYSQYEKMRTFHVRQFHFHTHEGKSLLRFHLLYENGDPLMELRTSVRVANTEYRALFGFEGGRIYPGYRYLFPIIHKGEHLGSVEFSISFEGIEDKLKNIFPDYKHELIMAKAISYDKVFEWHRDFFMPSDLSNDYFKENSELSKITRHIKTDPLICKLKRDIKEQPGFIGHLDEKRDFSIPIIEGDRGHIINFMAIDDTDGEHAGYVISYGESQDIIEIEEHYTVLLLLGGALSIVLLVSLLVIIVQFEKARLHHQRLERFIDIQDSIVILTDGVDFRFANKKFYDFFGYEDLEAFRQEQKCICDRFIEKGRLFSLSKVKEGEAHWIESLLNLSGRARVVSMLDKTDTLHTFTVSISQYDKDLYIIDFSDISDTMIEQLHLERQVTLDTLTGAYNRVYFDDNIEYLMQGHREKSQKTGIIFFDIDHFKEINDTYGHAVGDSTLQTIVSLIGKHIREDDRLIRWGGEEFIVITQAKDIDMVYVQAEHLRRVLEQYVFDDAGQVTCSFGVALHREGDDISDTVRLADTRLYEAKKRGRNKVMK